LVDCVANRSSAARAAGTLLLHGNVATGSKETFPCRRQRYHAARAAGARRRRPAGGFRFVGRGTHWFSPDADFTPVSDPAAAVSVQYRYVADQILFKAAFLAGF
jgi:hypothetical protein